MRDPQNNCNNAADGGQSSLEGLIYDMRVNSSQPWCIKFGVRRPSCGLVNEGVSGCLAARLATRTEQCCRHAIVLPLNRCYTYTILRLRVEQHCPCAEAVRLFCSLGPLRTGN